MPTVDTFKREYPFLGVEAEGPFRGKLTLFIPGNFLKQHVEVLLNSLFALHIIPEVIYVGSGNCRVSAYDGGELSIYLMDAFLAHGHPERRVVMETENHLIMDMWCGDSIAQSGKFAVALFLGEAEKLVRSPAHHWIIWEKWLHNGVIYWKNTISAEVHATSVSDPLFSHDLLIGKDPRQ